MLTNSSSVIALLPTYEDILPNYHTIWRLCTQPQTILLKFNQRGHIVNITKNAQTLGFSRISASLLYSLANDQWDGFPHYLFIYHRCFIAMTNNIIFHLMKIFFSHIHLVMLDTLIDINNMTFRIGNNLLNMIKITVTALLCPCK